MHVPPSHEVLLQDRAEGLTFERMAEKYGISLSLAWRWVADIPQEAIEAHAAKREREAMAPLFALLVLTVQNAVLRGQARCLSCGIEGRNDES